MKRHLKWISSLLNGIGGSFVGSGIVAAWQGHTHRAQVAITVGVALLIVGFALVFLRVNRRWP